MKWLLTLLWLFSTIAAFAGETPVQISVCQLEQHGADYDQKLVEITGFASHGFENSHIFDPACKPTGHGIWLEYGGRRATDTQYCCGVTPSEKRPAPFELHGITVELVDDSHFHDFNRALTALRHKPLDNEVHATLIGRFFAAPSDRPLGGYGHMGCCSLFVLQQVLDLTTPEDRPEYDEGYFETRPQASCYKDLEGTSGVQALKQQAEAENGSRTWAFSQPDKVVEEYTRNQSPAVSGQLLSKRTVSSSRIVYTFRGPGRQRYQIVTIKPFWLSFYTKNPDVIWLIHSAVLIGC